MGIVYTKLIRYLYNRLPQIESEETPRNEILEDYYNNKYPTEHIEYSGRVLPGSKTRFKVDVRDFFSLEDENLHNIIKSLRMANMSDNQKALSLLKYVIQNFPYKSDSSNYGLGEFWCMPFETIKKGSMDCEDGAILLANLMTISGIPEWKIRINAGLVTEPITKIQVGHAYVTFFDEVKEKWVILDWCYYPNLKEISDREEYKKEKMYDNIWFSFNSTKSWAANTGDIRNMPGFE